MPPSNAIDVVHVSVEREIATMEECAQQLKRLDHAAQRRVLNWLRDRYLGHGEDF